MVELKRKYIIPLRREFHKVPYYRKSKKAIIAIKAFCKKHMKVKEVKICRELNTKIWENNSNPPHKVEVEILKKDDVAIVNLIGKSLEIKTKESKEKEKNKKKHKEGVEQVKEEKKEETKKAITNLQAKESKQDAQKKFFQTHKASDKELHQGIIADGRR